ncbi:MAG TPA: GNAT family N-acetyltransferase [Dehalococcoidia bacterium]|nr:GNAT family N-acetyltransferase [Dehalococcoidia bacterium]
MNLCIIEQPATAESLAAYSQVSIAFTAASRFRVDLIDGGLGGVTLSEEPLTSPQFHDGDTLAGEGPARWAEWWDLSRWTLLCAFDGETRVGGAVVARHTEGMWFLRGREDMAALWDIRVAPAYRRRGVGSALFNAAADWARGAGCRVLKIETQSVNVAACRFYMAKGARLGGFDRFAYEDQPDEVELDWYLDL